MNYVVKINMDYNENCRSCIEFQSDDFSSLSLRCDLIDYNKHNECPCTFCLVKSMCKIPCNDYKKFQMSKLHLKKSC